MKTVQLSLTVIAVLVSVAVFGQNYTSSANGTWTTGSNWSGGAAPATSGQTWGTINMNHNMSINGNYSTSAGTVNVASAKQLTINGNFGISSGTTVNVYGTLYITGNASLSANLRVHPGGTVRVNGSVTVVSSQYLNVGTNVAPPAYADMIIMGNLHSQTSGDVILNRNARFALFGNLTNDGGGGTYLDVNNGAQMYIHGNVAMTGGADIYNDNTTDPYGLYINGSVSNTGGGATTDSNIANRATMQSTNAPFYNWVSSIAGGPLPVSLMFFRVAEIGSGSVKLVWATATEKNFDTFIIERSADGVSFYEIGSVKGAGNSHERNDYSLEDMAPMVGKAYYRLKALDVDGAFEYFNVVAAEYNGSRTVSTFPNPSAGNTMKLITNFEPGTNAKFQVFDSTGMFIGEYSASTMESTIDFSQQLRQGTYVLKYISDVHQQVIRFVVK